MGPPSESCRVHPLCDSVGAWCLRSRLQLQISTFQGRKMSIRILGTIVAAVASAVENPIAIDKGNPDVCVWIYIWILCKQRTSYRIWYNISNIYIHIIYKCIQYRHNKPYPQIPPPVAMQRAALPKHVISTAGWKRRLRSGLHNCKTFSLCLCKNVVGLAMCLIYGKILFSKESALLCFRIAHSELLHESSLFCQALKHLDVKASQCFCLNPGFAMTTAVTKTKSVMTWGTAETS